MFWKEWLGRLLFFLASSGFAAAIMGDVLHDMDFQRNAVQQTSIVLNYGVSKELSGNSRNPGSYVYTPWIHVEGRDKLATLLTCTIKGKQAIFGSRALYGRSEIYGELTKIIKPGRVQYYLLAEGGAAKPECRISLDLDRQNIYFGLALILLSLFFFFRMVHPLYLRVRSRMGMQQI